MISDIKKNEIKLSIVVCTYNREELLSICLDSLVNQTVDNTEFEIIVVNNNSTDRTAAVVKKYSIKHPNIRLVNELKQGTSVARNSGWKNAVSDHIAYIDDDAYAADTYVETAFNVINTGEYDCFGGVYLPWFRVPQPKWYKYGSNKGRRFIDGLLNNSDYMSAGNMVLKKCILQELGGFDESIGPVGNKYNYGEETELQQRIWDKNYKIGFLENLIVYHLVFEHKLNMRWHIKASFIHGYDSWLMFHQKPTVSLLFKIALSIPLSLMKGLIINSWHFFKRNDYYIQNIIIDSITPLSNKAGKLVSGIKYLICVDG